MNIHQLGLEMSSSISPGSFATNKNFYPKDIKSLLDSIVALIASRLDVEDILISLVKDNDFVVMAGRNYDDSVYKREMTLCNEVIKSNAILFLNDASKDKLYKYHPSVAREPNVKSYAGVPIYKDGKAVGTVCAYSCVANKINRTALTMLEQHAKIIAMALYSTNLNHQFEIEHSLFTKGPISTVLIEAKPGWPIVFVSDNCFTLLNIDIPEHKNTFRLDDYIVPEDRVTFKESLSFHRATMLTELETEYRLNMPDNSYKHIRQVSSGDYDAKDNLTYIRLYLIDETVQKDLENRLRSVKERSSLVLESMDLGTWDFSVKTLDNKVNQRWYDMIGLSVDDNESARNIWRTRVHPLDKNWVQAEVDELVAGKRESLAQKYRMKHENGQWIWVQVYGKVVEWDDDGLPTRLVGTQKDVTQAHQAEVKKKKQDALVALMSDAQHVFLKESDLQAACSGIFDAVLELAESEFGFIGEKIDLGDGTPGLKIQAITDISWDDDSRTLYQNYLNDGLVFDNLDNLFGRVIRTEKEVISNEVRNSPQSKGIPHEHPELYCILGLPIKFDGVVYGMIGFANRVSGYDREIIDYLSPLIENLGLLMKVRGIDKARQQAERELTRLATTDDLTKLPNRRTFMHNLRNHYNLNKRHGNNFCVAIIDIDQFKSINDKYGHDFGDKALIETAEVLRGNKRTVDFIARIGGEEFAMLIVESTKESCYFACERLRKIIESHDFKFDNVNLHITVSIGASVSTNTDSEIKQALKRADLALYEAKNTGRNKTLVYSQASKTSIKAV